MEKQTKKEQTKPCQGTQPDLRALAVAVIEENLEAFLELAK